MVISRESLGIAPMRVLPALRSWPGSRPWPGIMTRPTHWRNTRRGWSRRLPRTVGLDIQ